jgi:hypothetical protein
LTEIEKIVESISAGKQMDQTELLNFISSAVSFDNNRTTKNKIAMNIPDDILESFGNLIAEIIEHSPAVFYGLCLTKKHKKDIYISAPFFLVEAYQKYLSKKMKKREPLSDDRFMGIKIIPSPDYAITLFHKDYVVYKHDWMIRKMPLMPALEAYMKKLDSGFEATILPFVPGEIKSTDPSLN